MNETLIQTVSSPFNSPTSPFNPNINSSTNSSLSSSTLTSAVSLAVSASAPASFIASSAATNSINNRISSAPNSQQTTATAGTSPSATLPLFKSIRATENSLPVHPLGYCSSQTPNEFSHETHSLNGHAEAFTASNSLSNISGANGSTNEFLTSLSKTFSNTTTTAFNSTSTSSFISSPTGYSLCSASAVSVTQHQSNSHNAEVESNFPARHFIPEYRASTHSTIPSPPDELLATSALAIPHSHRQLSDPHPLHPQPHFSPSGRHRTLANGIPSHTERSPRRGGSLQLPPQHLQLHINPTVSMAAASTHALFPSPHTNSAQFDEHSTEFIQSPSGSHFAAAKLRTLASGACPISTSSPLYPSLVGAYLAERRRMPQYMATHSSIVPITAVIDKYPLVKQSRKKKKAVSKSPCVAPGNVDEDKPTVFVDFGQPRDWAEGTARAVLEGKFEIQTIYLDDDLRLVKPLAEQTHDISSPLSVSSVKSDISQTSNTSSSSNSNSISAGGDSRVSVISPARARSDSGSPAFASLAASIHHSPRYFLNLNHSNTAVSNALPPPAKPSNTRALTRPGTPSLDPTLLRAQTPQQERYIALHTQSSAPIAAPVARHRNSPHLNGALNSPASPFLLRRLTNPLSIPHHSSHAVSNSSHLAFRSPSASSSPQLHGQQQPHSRSLLSLEEFSLNHYRDVSPKVSPQGPRPIGPQDAAVFNFSTSASASTTAAASSTSNASTPAAANHSARSNAPLQQHGQMHSQLQAGAVPVSQQSSPEQKHEEMKDTSFTSLFNSFASTPPIKPISSPSFSSTFPALSRFQLTASENRFMSSLVFGVSALRGERSSMEDEFLLCERLDALVKQRVSAEEWRALRMGAHAFAGVYDGHGGKFAAEYLRDHLHRNIAKCIRIGSDVGTAIREGGEETEKSLLTKAKAVRNDAGSVAGLVVISGRQLHVSHAGDVRLVLSRAGEAVSLTADHRPTVLSEAERIRNLGGTVEYERLNGLLGASRAYGDFDLETNAKLLGLSADLEQHQWTVQDEDEFLIISSDGLWDVMSADGAVSFARKKLQEDNDIQRAAEELAKEALRRYTEDNVTVILIGFSRPSCNCQCEVHSSDVQQQTPETSEFTKRSVTPSPKSSPLITSMQTMLNYKNSRSHRDHSVGSAAFHSAHFMSVPSTPSSMSPMPFHFSSAAGTAMNQAAAAATASLPSVPAVACMCMCRDHDNAQIIRPPIHLAGGKRASVAHTHRQTQLESTIEQRTHPPAIRIQPRNTEPEYPADDDGNDDEDDDDDDDEDDQDDGKQSSIGRAVLRTGEDSTNPFSSNSSSSAGVFPLFLHMRREEKKAHSDSVSFPQPHFHQHAHHQPADVLATSTSAAASVSVPSSLPSLPPPANFVAHMSASSAAISSASASSFCPPVLLSSSSIIASTSSATTAGPPQRKKLVFTGLSALAAALKSANAS